MGLGSFLTKVGDTITGGAVSRIAGQGAYGPESTSALDGDTDAARKLRNQFSSEYSNWKPGTAPTIDPQAMDAYRQAAAGTAPSAAAIQSQQQLQQANLAGLAQAQGAHGTDRTMALRTAINGAAQNSLNAIATGAAQRAQEQEAGRAGLAGLASTQAGLQSTARSQDIADKAQVRSAALTSEAQPMAGDIQHANIDLANKGQARANDAVTGQAVATAAPVIASLFSDENAKTDIKPADHPASAFASWLSKAAGTDDKAAPSSKLPAAPVYQLPEQAVLKIPAPDAGGNGGLFSAGPMGALAKKLAPAANTDAATGAAAGQAAAASSAVAGSTVPPAMMAAMLASDAAAKTNIQPAGSGVDSSWTAFRAGTTGGGSPTASAPNPFAAWNPSPIVTGSIQSAPFDFSSIQPKAAASAAAPSAPASTTPSWKDPTSPDWIDTSDPMTPHPTDDPMAGPPSGSDGTRAQGSTSTSGQSGRGPVGASPYGAVNTGSKYGNVAGSAPLISDKRSKKDVKGVNVIDEVFGSLKPKTFEYKPEMGLGNQPHLGIIAQDVEKAGPLGKSMVKQIGNLKAIDVPNATGALMAAVADFSHRLRQLEGKPKKGR